MNLKEFASLGLIDNCHTNRFTDDEFDNATQYCDLNDLLINQS